VNDFAAALRDLNGAGVRYVIVGGLAVIRHGAIRATKEVDAAVAMDAENLARLDALVGRWHATSPDGTPLRTGELRPGGALALRTPHCLLDVLSEQLLPAPFADVLARSERKRIDGVEAPICSLADLVAMKRATGRGSDELDLERLREAHGELPGDP
jgi:predicted nucleotidyltransferase